MVSGLYNLKTKGGKFLVVMKFPGAMKLLAVDAQNKECNVSICYNTTKMAFRFKYGGSYFFLKVEEGNLKLEEVEGSKPIPVLENYWFQKEKLGSGDDYGLCTVVSPVKYVSMSQETQVILSGDKSQCVLVTLEKGE